MATFGSRVQALRTARGLTQEEMAKHFKISKSAVGMYERDEREPSLSLVQKLAEFFNVTTDYLLTGKSSPNTSQTSVPPEQAEFLQWVEENLEGSFFYDFHKSPEEQKEEMMETLRMVWELEKKRAQKKDK